MPRSSKLRRGSETHYRHIEFQSGNDPHMAERCFRYNSMLLLELGAPVLTSVLYVKPPAPAGRELVYRVLLDGVELNAWRFGIVRLWELQADAALANEAPGVLSLVPMLKGSSRATIETAIRKIRRAFPEQQMSDPEAILWLLARERYTEEELTPLIGRQTMQALIDLIKESPLWQEAWQEACAEGERKGRLQAERSLCLTLVRRHHPALLERAGPLIEACEDPAVLENWILATSEQEDEPLARLFDDCRQP